MTVITIPKILQDKLTPEGAEALIHIINTADEDARKNTIELTEERLEKRLAQIDATIETVKADMIKWMFIFWVGQIGVLTGILFAFFRR